MQHKKRKILWTVLLIGGTVLLFGLIYGTVVHASGLVDDTVDATHSYSKFPLDNYQLDFYVDTGWDWLPWNWKDGIGNQVQYGLYAIANFIWTISLYLSNATGYLVQQAYTLDFISDTADKIGKNMQTLAGVSTKGFGESGFYVGFLLLFILVVGIYVAYVGVIRHQTSKAFSAVTNFVVIFLVSAGFIAYAPSYIQKVNDFSADISQASLELGSKIILPHSDQQKEESVDLIRNTLFSVQVEQPWLLLQFDQSNPEKIGQKRIHQLLATSPDKNKGKDREKVVKAEINAHDNQNLTLTKTISRLGTVVFLVLFNFGISIFVFLLTGIMIFSQILFILYAMFLPISFLLSMLPTFTSMGKTALMKLFNTIMLRAGITLVITSAFSLSTMIYSLTMTYPFFLIAFLQIVTFAGIYLKLGDIMNLFSLKSSDSQQVGRSVFHRPRQYMNRGARRFQRTVQRSLVGGSAGLIAGKAWQQRQQVQQAKSGKTATHSKETTRSYQTGQTVGRVLDTKNRVNRYASEKKQQLQELPQNMAASAKRSVNDFKHGVIHEHPQIRKQDAQEPSSQKPVQRWPLIVAKKAERTGRKFQTPRQNEFVTKSKAETKSPQKSSIKVRRSTNAPFPKIVLKRPLQAEKGAKRFHIKRK